MNRDLSAYRSLHHPHDSLDTGIDGMISPRLSCHPASHDSKLPTNFDDEEGEEQLLQHQQPPFVVYTQ